ncbi:MAG: lipoprotein [Hyphomicrobiales bacterium]|nr:lipoprotein [Hyphomicrobiales bacterium]
MVALIATLMTTLSGCGRKGALDPPPAAGMPEPVVAAPGGAVQLQRQFGEPAVGPDGKPAPAPPPGSRQPFILDWLIQ